jgi:uncharacterized ferredoxin-like protein
MVNHTATDYHDAELSVPGHTAVVVVVHETGTMGLHCDECGWYAGSAVGRPGRWREQHMTRAWQRHLDHAAFGATIIHGEAGNVTADICRCVRCMIPWRAARNGERA